MKTPILFAAKALETDVEPVYSQGVYGVFVGALDDDKLPMYVIINKTTGVTEFTTEVFGVTKDWLNHFVKVEPGPLSGEQIELALN